MTIVLILSVTNLIIDDNWQSIVSQAAEVYIRSTLRSERTRMASRSSSVAGPDSKRMKKASLKG